MHFECRGRRWLSPTLNVSRASPSWPINCQGRRALSCKTIGSADTRAPSTNTSATSRTSGHSSSRRERPGHQRPSPLRGTTCSPRPRRPRRPGTSDPARRCGRQCRCFTSALLRRCWRRCWSAGLRYWRPPFIRPRYGTRCEPAAPWVSSAPAQWSRCSCISARNRATRSCRCASSPPRRSTPGCTTTSKSVTDAESSPCTA